MNSSECSHGSFFGQEKMEELCCLYALGELAPEETLRVRKHVSECRVCRTRVEEFERIMFFDLPLVEVLRSEGSVPEDPASVDAGKLLERVRETVRAGREEESSQPEWAQTTSVISARTHAGRFWRGAGLATLAAGWLVAATLFLDSGLLQRRPSLARADNAPKATPAAQDLTDRTEAVRKQLEIAQATVKQLQGNLAQTAEQRRAAQSEMARLRSDYQDLNSVNDAMRARMKGQEELLAQTSAQLQLTRDSLSSEMATKTALEAQLSDTYSRLEKQTQEVASLARAAATVPASYPIAAPRVREGEAQEILGARDLHIVDVYDVDGSGAAAHAYGRIYYVNHTLLLFYAFDLSKLEQTRKLVAFQAWGFRQPRSSKVESLGLFYLDNASLNRWALRVTNSDILSRIDTLYVTVEPPGGSRFPKGRRLLMASLAGPPNHP